MVRPRRSSRRCRSTRRTAGSPIPAWSTNPWFYGVRLAYLSTCRYAHDVVGAASVEAEVARKAELALNLAARRAVAHQLPRPEPGGPQAGLRHRRGQRRQGRDDLPRRPGQQQRPAAPGRRQRLRGGPQPRRDPGQGRVPQRAHGAHPVLAADRAGPRPPAAVQPAVDQQVLRDGSRARPQLHRVGGAARPHGLLDQLPQPVQGHGPHDHGRLPAARPAEGAGRRCRRSPAPRRSTSSGCAWAVR